jgi:uncharacterized protein
MNRWRILPGLVLLLVVTASAGCQPGQRAVAASPAVGAPAAAAAPARSISVSGSAEVRVVPDEVVLTLGVETWDKDINIAKRANDDIVQRVAALAKDYGLEPTHIQTDYISIEPRYEDSYENRRFIGYFVRKTIALTLSDVAQFEKLLSAVLAAGVNYVHGVDFRTTDLRKYRDQARALAIRAAQEKAQALAGELGQGLGAALTVREEQDSWWASYGAWWSYRGGTAAQNVTQNAGGAGGWDAAAPTAPGQIAVSARVTVEYELR